MFHYFFFTNIIIISSMFLFLNHPLLMGFTLIIMTMFISIFTGLLTKTFWFSYSLFLIFIGGMLILLMYMTAIASNEILKFNLNFNSLTLFFIIFLSISILLFLNFDNIFIFINKIFNLNNLKLNFINLIQENNFSLNKLYNFPMNMITILLINYLFLTLIMTVKITNIFEGPLRKKS